MIGRFYLMHPIGVRPETANFEISSSFDYSFIPKMCPSGRILTLVDSDEYFVAEMQTRDHEHDKLIPGPLGKAELAAQLSEWTTAQHRANAAQTVVFHAAAEPADLATAVAEADRYIAGVAELLSPEPQPHRGHRYWIGSIAVNRARTGRALSREDWQFLLEEALPKRRLARLALRLRLRIFGTLPEATLLHPRWPDYQLLCGVLEKAVAEGQRLLLVAEKPAVFAHWLVRTTVDAATVEIGRLLGASSSQYRSLFSPTTGEFTACVVLLPETHFRHSGELLHRVVPLLVPGAQISLVAMNERPASVAAKFAQAFASQTGSLVNLSTWVGDAQYMGASWVRWRTYRAMRWFADHASRSRWSSPVLLGLLYIVPLGLVSCVTNTAAKATRIPPRLVSSILVQLRLSSRAVREPWADLAERRIGGALAEPDPVASTSRDNYPADLLAKYGFVSGVLAHRHDVAAYECVDDFGSRMVLENVKKLSVYDPDPSRIGEISRKIFDPWKFDACVHDILKEPLPRVYDAIYNLDTLEYISPDDEHRYLGDLSRSLARHQDILIIGLKPCDADDDTTADGVHLSLRTGLDLTSSDRQPLGLLRLDDAGRLSNAPNNLPRYRRTSAGVRALLESHFQTVSLFSLTAGVVQAGASGAGGYLFALCSSKKS